MPTVLADPTPTIYVVLGAMVLILGAGAYRRQKKADIAMFVVGLVLAIALVIIDRAIESPREQAVRKIVEMGSASRAHRPDDLFKHVSDSFKYKSMDKKGLREKAIQADSTGLFGGITEYSVDRSGFEEMADGTIQQAFRIKHNGSPPFLFFVEASFKKEADGEWRLVSFRLFDPVNTKDERDLPHN